MQLKKKKKKKKKKNQRWNADWRQSGECGERQRDGMSGFKDIHLTRWQRIAQYSFLMQQDFLGMDCRACCAHQ